MNFKTTYVLFGLVLAVVTLVIVAVYRSGPSEAPSGWVMSAMHEEASPIKPEDVNEVVIRRRRPKEEEIVFIRDKDDKTRWYITSPRKLRADSNAVDGLVRALYDARRDKQADKPA